MKKLKRAAISLAASSTKMAELAAPGKKVVEEKGKFLGKLVRIATDTSHLCGHLVDVKSNAGTKVMGQPVYKDYLKDFIAGIEKAPHQIICDEKDVIDVAEITRPDPKPAKHLKFRQDERVELEIQFHPAELQGFSSFEKDPRFAAIHMNMWYWLLR